MKFTDLGDKGPRFKLQDMTEEFVDEASLAQMRDYFAGKMSLTDEPAKSKPGELARMRDHFSKEKPMAKGGTAPNTITDKMPPDIVMILHAINKGTAITKAQFNRLHSYKMYGESVEDVAEASPRVDSLVTDALKIMQGAEVADAVAALKTVLGNREYNSRRGHYNFYVKQIMDMSGQQGVAEGDLKEFAPVGGDDREPNEEEILRKLAAQWWHGDEDPRAEKTLAAMGWEIGQDESGDDDAGVFVVRAGDINGNSYMAFNQSDLDLNEGSNPEYDDEAGMAKSNLHTMARAVNGLLDTIGNNENLPEWAQEKIAKAEMMVTGVWDYLLSQEEQGIDPQVDEASLAQMRDYFNQTDNNTVKLDNQYGSPVHKKPANVPPEIQNLINKMYRAGKITPQEFEILKSFQARTGMNVGLKVKEAGILFANTKNK